MFQFTPLYAVPATQEPQLGIHEAFNADLLSVHLGIAANLDRLDIVLGTIYQYFGPHCAAYELTRARTVFKLLMPKTDLLVFVPNTEFYSGYGLSISYASLPTGTMSDYVLPENIAGLPVRVDALETSQAENITYFENINTILESLENVEPVNWSTLQGKPSAFTPSSHTHGASEIAGLPTNNGTSSLNPILVTANQTLEIGKNYLATVSGLQLTLPASPNEGDLIRVMTENFDTRIAQNTGQMIRNLNTQTGTGADRGIVLKPYSSIELLFVGAGLWVSGFRSRTINNYEPISIESIANLKAYTPSYHTAVSPAFGTVLDNINNNQLGAGNFTTNGVLIDVANLKVIAALSAPIRLDSFDFYGGQGNVANGSANNGYKVETVNVYGGSTLDTLIGTFSTTNINGAMQSFTTDTGGIAYDSYVFEFIRTGTGIGIIELDIFGRGQTGGEVIAT